MCQYFVVTKRLVANTCKLLLFRSVLSIDVMDYYLAKWNGSTNKKFRTNQLFYVVWFKD